MVMRLSARADYALRAAIELAAAGPGHVTADQLARAQQIPGKFLETILTQLRRAGLIRSQRGPDGGFWLARPAAEISLADIIRVIDGQLLGVRGERPENVTYPGAAEPLQRSQLLAALSVGAEIIRLHRICRRFDLGSHLDAALEPLARGDSATAIVRLARLDEALAARPGAATLRARSSILTMSEALIQHAAYFDAGAMG